MISVFLHRHLLFLLALVFVVIGSPLQAQPTLPDGGGGGTNGGAYVYAPMPYMPGLKLAIQPLNGTNLFLNLLEADPAGKYDVYSASNLVSSVWSDILSGTNGQTNFSLSFPNLAVSFYRAARTDTPSTNTAGFSAYFPSFYVSNNIVGAIVSGGVGTEMAVLVNDTNHADARWVPFSAVPYVSLGTDDGTYQVMFGFIGSDGQTNWVTSTVTLDTMPPAISISSPTNSSAFNASRVDVSGSFTETNLKQITVNGVSAFVNGTNFDALNVPLAAGANSISAVATDFAGNVNSTSINITGFTNTDSSLNNPVQLQATPIVGFVPLQVTFSVQTNVPGTIQQVSYDFNGDDIADFVTNNLSSITHTYATNGEFFPVVTIQTSAGRFSSIGGWNAVALDPSNQPVQINVQPALTQTIFATITDPVDLKWSGTNLYVLSGSTATITEYATNGTSIRSKSGLGTNPSGFDVDAAGNVYVAVTAGNQVWKFNPVGSSFIADTNFGIGGCIGLTNGTSGTNASAFNAPFDVAVTPDGSQISVSDSGNNRIQQFSTNGAFVATFGTGGSAIGQFSTPEGLAYDSVGNLYIADSGNNRIAVGQDFTILGVSGTNGTALGQFSSPANISVDQRGVYVADTGNNRIESFNPLGNGIYNFAPSDIRFAVSTNLNAPAAVAAVDNLTNEMFYVADTGNNRVLLYTLPVDDPTPAWNNMTNQIAAGNVSAAVSSFCNDTADWYQQSFLVIGTASLISDVNQIGTLTPVFIRNDRAEYYFEKSIEGHTILFPVEFVKENGVWKIISF